MIPVDTGFWRKRWDDTCGYLLFKDSFTALDVLNARFRYNRVNDDDFPIAFDKTTYSIIENKLKNRLDRRLFWAAVVAPTQSFFDWDWMSYAPRGESFREINLVGLATTPELLNKLPESKREEAYKKVIDELRRINGNPKYKAPKVFVKLPDIKKKNAKIVAEEYPTSEDVKYMLDEIL